MTGGGLLLTDEKWLIDDYWEIGRDDLGFAFVGAWQTNKQERERDALYLALNRWLGCWISKEKKRRETKNPSKKKIKCLEERENDDEM